MPLQAFISSIAQDILRTSQAQQRLVGAQDRIVSRQALQDIHLRILFMQLDPGRAGGKSGLGTVIPFDRAAGALAVMRPGALKISARQPAYEPGIIMAPGKERRKIAHVLFHALIHLDDCRSRVSQIPLMLRSCR